MWSVLALLCADASVITWNDAAFQVAAFQATSLGMQLDNAGLPFLSKSFSSCALRTETCRIMDCQFSFLAANGVKNYLLSELKSAPQKFLRRSMDHEFLSIYVFVLSALGAAYKLDPAFKRFVTNMRNRLSIMSLEEGCFMYRTLESFDRLVVKKKSCENADSVSDMVITALDLAVQMTCAPVRNRSASHYMHLVEAGVVLPAHLDPDWEEHIKPIYEKLRLKNNCEEKRRGLDYAAAYMVFKSRGEHSGFPDKAPQSSVAACFSFYTRLDDEGVIEKIGVRDKHTRNAKPEHKTDTFFADVSATCVFNEEHMKEIDSIRIPLRYVSNEICRWTHPQMKTVYDANKHREMGKGASPEKGKKRGAPAEPRLVMDEKHPLGFKILTMKVTPLQFGPLAGLLFDGETFETIFEGVCENFYGGESACHLKHVENISCILVQRLAKKVGIDCAEVLKVLSLDPSQNDLYIEQLEKFYDAARNSTVDTERFTPTWADRSMRVTNKKLKKEKKGNQTFLLSEWMDIIQLVTLLDEHGIDKVDCPNFRTSYTRQMILNWLLPLNEANTSNFGVDKDGKCVRFDFCMADYKRELWVRQECRGLNTHGQSMGMKMKNGRRPLIEIFNQGLQELGPAGVVKIIESVHDMLVELMACVAGPKDLQKLAGRWYEFFSKTPAGIVWIGGGSNADVFQVFTAYMKKDKRAFPKGYVESHGVAKFIK